MHPLIMWSIEFGSDNLHKMWDALEWMNEFVLFIYVQLVNSMTQYTKYVTRIIIYDINQLPISITWKRGIRKKCGMHVRNIFCISRSEPVIFMFQIILGHCIFQ